VLFIDLRTWNKNVYEKSYVTFDEEQIAHVKRIYNEWQGAPEGNGCREKKYKNTAELCQSAKIAEIRKNDYSLVPSKYIKFIDHDLDIDYEKEMQRIQAEMRALIAEEKESQKALAKAFKGIGYGIE
jgi:type I restriction enzyme M protein